MVIVPFQQASFILVSRIPLFHNALKSLLFRLASLLLQTMAIKLLGYIAYKMGAYTSFVMFAEGIIQKYLYLQSRKWKKQSLLVLYFAILIPLTGVFDTVLWSLDKPGYVIQSSTITAPSLASRLVASPSYLIPLTHRSKDPRNLNLDEAFAANLYQPGFNISFPGIKSFGERVVVPPIQSFTNAGPRIWLDDEGFSMSIDQEVMFIPGGNPTPCKVQTTGTDVRSWSCVVDNTGAMEYIRWATGQPYVWWDSVSSINLIPERKDNPWLSCGAGLDTTALKQIFTVTKGNKRHTFLETVFKSTLFALSDQEQFERVEVLDMVRRTDGLAGPNPIGSLVAEEIADAVMSTQSRGMTLTSGSMWQDPYSVASRYTELLALNHTQTGARIYSTVRVITTNITLIRSETLPEVVQPSIPCTRFSMDIATGGQVRYNTCYKAFGDQVGARFLGKLDTSSAVIFNDVLGDGTSSKSAVALNQTSLDWFKRNNDRIDQMLASRALILGGDATIVPVNVERTQPAISYLQLIVLTIPLLFALVVFPLSIQDKIGFYRSSFFAAVCATTHVVVDSKDACQKIDHLKNPPELSVEDTGHHIVLRTPDGGYLANASGLSKSDTYETSFSSSNLQATFLHEHKEGYNSLPQV